MRLHHLNPSHLHLDGWTKKERVATVYSDEGDQHVLSPEDTVPVSEFSLPLRSRVSLAIQPHRSNQRWSLGRRRRMCGGRKETTRRSESAQGKVNVACPHEYQEMGGVVIAHGKQALCFSFGNLKVGDWGFLPSFISHLGRHTFICPLPTYHRCPIICTHSFPSARVVDNDTTVPIALIHVCHGKPDMAISLP